jgi:hypothetical protein
MRYFSAILWISTCRERRIAAVDHHGAMETMPSPVPTTEREGDR